MVEKSTCGRAEPHARAPVFVTEPGRSGVDPGTKLRAIGVVRNTANLPPVAVFRSSNGVLRMLGNATSGRSEGFVLASGR